MGQAEDRLGVVAFLALADMEGVGEEKVDGLEAGGCPRSRAR